MKTAVEWLIEERFGSIEDCTPMFRTIIEQAKQMEKEQIKNSFDNGYYEGSVGGARKGEYYYNETFKLTNE